MNSLDILFEVATKLDNNGLLKLFLSSAQESLTSLLHSPLFWYARCQHLVGRCLIERSGCDWKRVYNSLLASIASKNEPTLSCLGDLDSVLVCEELHGEPDWNMDEEHIAWLNVSSTEVLSFLLDRSLISSDPRIIVHWLSSELMNVDILRALLYLIDDTGVLCGRTFEKQLVQASRSNRLDNYTVLLEYATRNGAWTDEIRERCLCSAIKYGSMSIVKSILDCGGLSLETIYLAIIACIEAHNDEALSPLMQVHIKLLMEEQV